MTPRHLAALTCLLTLAATPVQAQETGRLEVYAFTAGGHPAPDVLVAVGAASARTGADGAARLALPAGRHELVLRVGGRVVAQAVVPVAWGEVTEVIARLPSGPGDADVDVEAPGWPRAPADVPHEAAATGELAGAVRDARTGAPVVGARILVRGELREAVTNPDGGFRLVVPAGTRTVSVIHAEYATLTREVVVLEGRAAALDVELTPSAVQLDALRVSGYQLEGGLASLLQERREDRAVTEVLGAEQISRSGDSNAAAALRRVTGLTVVDGKYVFIRGMGERYATTLLNGATLPSPEPERRVVPLNLFPTDVIESIAVQKSYSADLPGEFGGGTVLIRTKGIPEEPFVKATASTTYREGTTGERGLTYRGGRYDWLGYDDGSRALPKGVRIAADFEPLHLEDPLSGEGWPIEVLEGLGEAMPNTWSAQRETIDPDVGVGLAAGNRHDVLGGTAGYLLGLTYGNGYQLTDGIQRTLGLGAGGALVPIVDYRRESLLHTVNFGSLVSLGYRPVEGHELTVTSLWVRTTKDETEVYQGLLGNDDAFIRVTSLDFVEEQLWSTQTRGEHALPGDAQLEWSYTYSYASRYQPDSRQTRFDLDPARGDFVLSNRPEGNQRLYNDLADDNHDLELSLDLPFGVWSDLVAHVKMGAGYVYRDRESETRRFKFIHRGPRSLDPDVLAQPAELIFSPQNIGADGFSFEEITRATDQYEAVQTIESVFLTLELPLLATLDLSLGARIERSDQEVTTFNLFSRGAAQERADLETTDVLPAVNLTWRFREDMQLRLGYSRTLSRPDFRELSSAPFDQVIGAGVFIGNPDLDRTVIDNVDLRWEWYLSPDETVSVGLFFKQLHDPIESIILGGANRTLTLENAESGRNIGVELEFRKRLGFLHELLDDLYLSSNVALIRSEVELDRTGVATESSRPLQGQSEYVVNAAFGWDDPDTGTSLALLYNVFGERIVGIGTFGLPDVYEQPVHQLDLVGAWEFYEGWTLKTKIQNLLDARVRVTQGGRTVERYEKGRAWSLSLSAEF